MTDTATLDRPCIHVGCRSEAAADSLFCPAHGGPIGWNIHIEHVDEGPYDPEDSPYHDLAGATEDDPRL